VREKVIREDLPAVRTARDGLEPPREDQRRLLEVVHVPPIVRNKKPSAVSVEESS
jgi:hypothetical protein